jgi:hypothetical protein
MKAINRPRVKIFAGVIYLDTDTSFTYWFMEY